MIVEDWDITKVIPYENNPRDNDSAVDAVRASIEEFDWQQPIVVDGSGTIIVGHTRYKAALAMGLETVPVKVAENLTPEQCRAYRLADNRTHDLSGWLDAMLAEELEAIEGIDMSQFGFDAGGVDFSNLEAMMGEKDDAYNEFVDKFKPKHTTDDCFTPPEVYEAVKAWVLREYGIPEETEIVRPFYPGGDYQAFRYPKGCLVLDNPPFSIQAEICRFYVERGIDFFLFANGLTLLTNVKDGVNGVIAHCQITYENGAEINTSFLTNMGKGLRVSASLHDAVEEAQPKKYVSEQASYDWPDNVITSAMLGRLAVYGSEFRIENFERVSKLDDGTAIFGNGALISDAKAEKAKAEKAKAEKAKIPVTLSERERRPSSGGSMTWRRADDEAGRRSGGAHPGVADHRAGGGEGGEPSRRGPQGIGGPVQMGAGRKAPEPRQDGGMEEGAMDGMIEARCPNGDAIIFAIDFVPREWATGWEINGRIVSALRGMDALLTNETMPKTVRALKELEALGFVEKRRGPNGFAEWRLAGEPEHKTHKLGGSE